MDPCAWLTPGNGKRARCDLGVPTHARAASTGEYNSQGLITLSHGMRPGDQSGDFSPFARPSMICAWSSPWSERSRTLSARLATRADHTLYAVLH